MFARSLRYYVEGILAVIYGRRVLLFIRDNGLVIVSIVASLIFIGLLVYFYFTRKRVTVTGAEGTMESLDPPATGKGF